MIFRYILNIWFVNTFCGYTLLSDQTILLLIIQFSISHFFALSLNVKQFYLTHRYEPIRGYHSGPEWTWEQWQWRSTPHSQKLHQIVLCSIQDTHCGGGGVLPHSRDIVCVFYSPSRLGKSFDKTLYLTHDMKITCVYKVEA